MLKKTQSYEYTIEEPIFIRDHLKHATAIYNLTTSKFTVYGPTFPAGYFDKFTDEAQACYFLVMQNEVQRNASIRLKELQEKYAQEMQENK